MFLVDFWRWNVTRLLLTTSIVDPHHIDADPDSTYHPDAYPDSYFYLMRTLVAILGPKKVSISGPNPSNATPDPSFHPDADSQILGSFQIKGVTLEKVLK